MRRSPKLDRFLILRNEIYYYWRRVPTSLVALDSRAPIVRYSLKTNDLAKARAERDMLEKADDELWAAMSDGKVSRQAIDAYRAAKSLAKDLGFTYYPADELARRPLEDILRRIDAVMDTDTPENVVVALLGGEPLPRR